MYTMRRALRMDMTTPLEIVTLKHQHGSDHLYGITLDDRRDVEELLRYLSREKHNEIALCQIYEEERGIRCDIHSAIPDLAGLIQHNFIFLVKTMYFHHHDSATPVIDYITAEMNKNAKSDDVFRIKDLYRMDMKACIIDWQNRSWWQKILGAGMTPDDCINLGLSSKAGAFLVWAMNVRQDGPWDHKPHIRRTFNSRNPQGEQELHRLGLYAYFYDVWSNIHYGYVGRACGFGKDTLLDGAGLEQIGSDVVAQRLPKYSGGIYGLKKFDDAKDRTAISLGMDLYEKYPGNITTAQLKKAIIETKALRKKLYFKPQNAW